MPTTRNAIVLTLISVTALITACASPASDDPVGETPMNATTPASQATLPTAPRSTDAMATLIDRSGEAVGSASFYQGTDGVILRIAVSGIEPGVHGMHFHAKGTCEDPEEGFMATGGHIMPLGKPHGYMNTDGPHAGNLPNLIVHADGTAVVELHTHLVTVTGGNAALLDADGSTLIIHENEDDHLTQPIGGAGGRLICGVVEAG